MELQEALKIISDNGYIAVKLTEAMKRDIRECQRCMDIGESKECYYCSCNICICT